MVMDDKVVLVVGGAGSIGAEAARQFAAHGARVLITYRDASNEAAAATATLASLAGGGHATFPADVAQTSTLEALRDEIERRFGRLDVLVNAAALAIPR
jgi:3-oxoacyl-[acyl-carrier protein] reductase